jgi:glucokinase
LATGGVFLAGGIALHLLKFLQEPKFVQTFTRKGRFKDLLERIPIHVITTRAALLGAATFGLQSLKSVKKRHGEKVSLAPV